MKFALINRHGNPVFDRTVLPMMFTPTKVEKQDGSEEYRAEIDACTDSGIRVTLKFDHLDEDTVRFIQNFFVEEFTDGSQ